MPWYFSCKSHWFCGLVQIHPQDVVVFILNTATESGWLSPWDPPLPWGKVHERIYRPATHPIHFAAYFTRQNHRCAAWAVFFFFTNKILCSCSIFQNLFLVVDCTTAKCYSCAWKKQVVVSALRPAFFILYLESYISRLNEILRHDLTLSVGEPDNAAAKQGQELRSVWTVTMSRGFAFSHVLLCKIFNVHCGSTSEIFSVARKGRKQVSTCGHKFSMLENSVAHSVILVGECLPQTLLQHCAGFSAKAACRIT